MELTRIKITSIDRYLSAIDRIEEVGGWSQVLVRCLYSMCIELLLKNCLF